MDFSSGSLVLHGRRSFDNSYAYFAAQEFGRDACATSKARSHCYANVAAKLQRGNRGESPLIDLDFGINRGCVEFPGDHSLAAHPEVDAGLPHAMNHGDIGIVIAYL